MNSANAAPPLWQPSQERIDGATITRFQAWAAEQYGAPAGGGYAALHRWSIEELDTFWKAVADWFGVRFTTPYESVLADRSMPGAQWFPGATLNYAEHALRTAEDPDRADGPALLHVDESHEPRPVSWSELRRQVGALAAELRALGVRPGDRVSGYLPNIPQAVTALLATAAVGAVWTSCAPDFGARSVLDRFQQVEPVVLFAVDGYRYGGKEHDRSDTVAELRGELPTLRAVVHIPLLGTPAPEGALDWSAVTAGDAEPVFEQVPFDHPLWVLYSSGTTGLPKAIVQSQGGILLEHFKQLGLHCDLGPDDRFFWYTSTGWMMWNFLVSGLLTGTTIVLYDGSPGFPDTGAQWRIAERTGATFFGTSAAYVMACRKADLHPARDYDLSRVTCVATTGSPLPPDGFRWLHEAAGESVWIASVSGGTDVCSCFAGCRPHPAGAHRRTPGGLPRHRPPGLGRTGQTARRGGRRTRRHPTHAVHADPFLERPRRQPLPEQLLRHVPRSLAARRLDHDHRPRLRDHPRPLRLDPQQTGGPHGFRRHLRSGRTAPRDP